MDKQRSETMKNWWNSLSKNEQESIMSNRFKNGRSYSQRESGPNNSFEKILEDNNIKVDDREYCLDKKLFDFKVNDILIEINPTITHNSTFTPFKYNKPLNKNYEYELVRYCSSKNVIGGSEKLLKHFMDSYNTKSLISYCDLSKFSGQTYEKLGFTLLRKSGPTKHWYGIILEQKNITLTI